MHCLFKFPPLVEKQSVISKDQSKKDQDRMENELNAMDYEVDENMVIEESEVRDPRE